MPMRAQPWFGFWRGLLFALLPGWHYTTRQQQAGWAAAARRRRIVLLLSVLGLTAVTVWLSGPDVHPAVLALQSLLFAWVSIGCVTAAAGAFVLVRGDARALRLADPRRPIPADARTAIVMTICNEDIATVFAGLRATCESLAATGALKAFDVYILSDSSDPLLRAAELQAWARLRAILGEPADGSRGHVYYRWRRVRRQRKAGNVADFCRRWGRNYRYMVVLDADSTMHGDTLVALVRLMEEHPRAGIVQTLPQAIGHSTLHARTQQFAARVSGRLFALGMAWWQMGESHYWGHNAILRVEPFMRHCALARLPGHGGLAGEILSHDFVEAALMRRAGYEVWLAPDLGGSWEQHPTNLVDELQRDRRWCHGNLQNARLLAEPGWRPAHRVMFAIGALSYGVAPLWLLFVLFVAALPGAGPSPALWASTAGALLLPRVLAVAALRWTGGQRDFGGSARLVSGALLETLLSALLAPVRMLAHSAFVLAALTGLKLEWKSPPRDARAVRWGDALARVGMLALPAAAGGGLLLAVHGPAWHLAPLALPLLLAVPFTVWGGSERLGATLRDAGWLRIAEEHRPPRTLVSAGQRRSFADLAVMPTLATAAVGGGGPKAPAFWRRSVAATALGLLALFATALMPWPTIAPETRSLPLPDDRLASVADDPPPLLEPVLPAPQPPALTRRVMLRVIDDRPGARIDDDVRRRASEFVHRALAEAEV